MNIFGTGIHRNLRLISRNEGRIKTYESCTDLRAWSHDLQVKDRYLREWIKCDMPTCVLPLCDIASFFRTMTCRSRAKTTPRCHPDCKSKVLLDSICASCHVIKECLKNEPSFDKYFAEEEFETSHWPCDKCLDVLKGIKMFWKIIIEKIFGINFPKTKEFENIQDSRTDNLKSVAKLWEKELVRQTLFVKNVTPFLCKAEYCIPLPSPWKQSYVNTEARTRIPRSCKTENSKASISLKINKVKSPTNSIACQKTRSADIGRYSFYRNFNKTTCRKVNKGISVRLQTVDEACDSCNIDNDNDDLRTYKKNVEILQEKCNSQELELEKLKNENNSLKIELQNFYKTCSWKSYPRSRIVPRDEAIIVPKPFECCVDDSRSASSVNNVDSEMIITMKNCKNEGFRHVSLLQVLHKTNEPIKNSEPNSAACIKKENPIELLSKVQNTFVQIMGREMILAKDKRCTKHSDIDATFYKLKNSKSAPSYSTICSESVST